MNKVLHVFGDSFSALSKTPLNSRVHVAQHPDWQWHVSLANRLGTDLRVTAEFGVANDWISLNLLHCLEDFKSGDKVIVQTTQAARHWFFESKPFVSNVHGIRNNLVKEGILTKEQAKTLELYYKHIQTEEKDQLQQEKTFSFISSMKWILNHSNVELIILPGFDQPNIVPIAGAGVVGTMQTIAKNEFIDHNAGMAWYAQPNLPDQRLNHMCKDNHVILTDRLYDQIKNKTKLNLVDGYYSRFLSIATQQADQLSPNPINGSPNPISPT